VSKAAKEDPLLMSDAPPTLLFHYSPRCIVNDTRCGARPTAPAAIAFPNGLAKDFELKLLQSYISSEFASFFDRPLERVGLGAYVKEIAVSPIDSALPFDVSAHPHCKNAIAKATLKRLREHRQIFADNFNKSTETKLACIHQLVESNGSAAVAEKAAVRIRELQVRACVCVCVCVCLSVRMHLLVARIADRRRQNWSSSRFATRSS
jgi:hypothetical protein